MAAVAPLAAVVIVAMRHDDGPDSIVVFQCTGPEDFDRICELTGEGKPFAHVRECRIRELPDPPGPRLEIVRTPEDASR